MYTVEPFTGADLPDHTLCITFDDGPGEHTYAIGKYLADEGICATFFVVGKYAYEHPDTLKSLKDLGHIIANHTYEHPDMPYYRSENGDVQDQIIRTDGVIKNFISGDITYFRSPYGKWSAEVASDLNSNLMSASGHLGPIHWDMGGMDCYYWQLGRSAEDAWAEYYKEIAAKKKGILLFHDEIADMDFVKPRNKTLELLKLLIPKLKAEGYRFVGLEEVKSIKTSAEKKLIFHLKTRKQHYISVREDQASSVYCTTAKSLLAEFNMEKLSHGKVAFQSSNSFYLCVGEDDGNKIRADKKEIEASCLFDFIPLSNNRFMLRATNGNYFTVDKKNNLFANAPYMRNSEVFSYHPLNLPAKTAVTFRERLSLIKKRFLYIKSKLGQA